MAYSRQNTQDGTTKMSKALYDNLQDGIDEALQKISELTEAMRWKDGDIFLLNGAVRHLWNAPIGTKEILVKYGIDMDGAGVGGGGTLMILNDDDYVDFGDLPIKVSPTSTTSIAISFDGGTLEMESITYTNKVVIIKYR